VSRRYRIHEFAELAGVTVKALHHYDRIGLLQPARSDAGYRLYTARDLERLEQIIALKFLGLPLRQIRSVLDAAPVQLRDALRAQLRALQEKQDLLARAVRAIQAAEQSIQPGGAADPALLKRIIEVIDMQDLELMKKYFSDEAWISQKPRYEHGPSPEWLDLYREAGTLLAEDPASERALDLARRWVEKIEHEGAGNPGVLIGRLRAWEDRDHWPPAMKREIAEYNLEAVYRFTGKAVLAHRKKYASDDFWITRDPRAWASVPWYLLSAEGRVVLGAAPAVAPAPSARSEWIDLMNRSTRVDPAVQERSIQAWEQAQDAHRLQWREWIGGMEAAAADDPAGDRPRRLASRWVELWDHYLRGDAGVHATLTVEWSAAAASRQPRVAELLGEALAEPLQTYFTAAAWSGLREWGRSAPVASLQASARAQISLYRDAEAAMRGASPEHHVPALALRWNELVERDSPAQAAIHHGIRNAWFHRRSWPPCLIQHVASLHLMDRETFERVSDFIAGGLE